MIPILLVTSSASQSEARRAYTFLSPSGLIRMLTLATSMSQFLHSLFNVVLVGLDIHSELNYVVFCFLHGWLSGQWNLMHRGQACFSWLCSLEDIFVLSLELQGLGPPESGWWAGLLLCVGVLALTLPSWLSKPLLWLRLWCGETGSCLCFFWCHLGQKDLYIFW